MIFARILHNRLRTQLDSQHSCEQYGFCPGRSTNDALLVFEEVVRKCPEWQVPLWVISLDLQKAFDRVEQAPLFEALLSHGMDSMYVSLLQRLYEKQTGSLDAGRSFPIRLGVRQGDVISPGLFMLHWSLPSDSGSSDCGLMAWL